LFARPRGCGELFDNQFTLLKSSKMMSGFSDEGRARAIEFFRIEPERQFKVSVLRAG